MTKMILHARSTNKLSQKFAIQVTARSLFLSILGDSWKLIQDPQGTHFAFAFGSKFANHLVATKSISVFKVQKDAHFVFSSKMIQGPQGTHFPFAFESKFANHLFATKSIWVSNSRFKFQKVRILPSVLGQSYKDPQMVPQNDNYKKVWLKVAKISGFVIEMKRITSDYAQKYLFRRWSKSMIGWLGRSKIQVSVRRGPLRAVLLKSRLLHSHKERQDPQYEVKMICRTRAGPICDFTKWKLKIRI